ncbi:MAG TPA: hypothetical protein VLA14_07210 [Polyangia bacterium]|nr:hypothetical protein [Polyangia bacterium]
MSESAHLLRMLARIRRRARALAALEGAVAGSAAVLSCAAIAGAIARARGGGVPWRAALAAASVAAVAGACVAAARRIALVRCARWLDAAIERGGSRAHDRVLSALTFVERGGARPGPALVQAAIADAVARARSFGPAVVRPARRPAALPALGGAVLALVVVAAWPAPAPAARDVTRASSPSEPAPRVTAGALEAERAELRALGDAADASGDVELRAAAREARVTLDALSDGTLGRGDLLERLTALATRARQAAEESAGEQAALRTAGKALEATAATRALGRALAADDARETAHALRDLADRAASSAAARAAAAQAFAAASGATTSTTDAGGDERADGRRHLARDRDSAGAAARAAAADDTRDRHLERLRRDLDDAARACGDDAATCAARLRDQTNDVPRLAREAAQASARRRLATTVEHLRERLQRGDLDQAARDPSERRFARAANGAAEGRQPEGQPRDEIIDGRGSAGSDQAAGAPSMASADGDDDVFSSEPEASGEAAGDGKGGSAQAAGGDDGAPAQGRGYGHENGGDPLGRGATPPTRGRAREAHVRDGAGPTRSEVIEASARRGFAARDYVRVFEDYQPVVEESLATDAVPEGRRYVVRRYFQLIRPRARTP